MGCVCGDGVSLGIHDCAAPLELLCGPNAGEARVGDRDGEGGAAGSRRGEARRRKAEEKGSQSASLEEARCQLRQAMRREEEAWQAGEIAALVEREERYNRHEGIFQLVRSQYPLLARMQ